MQEKDGIITEVLIIPGTESSEQNAVIKLFMMPNIKAVGSIHSHPGPNRNPSKADLHMFSKIGNYHIIVGYPYNKQSWTCYDKEGNITDLPVIDDEFEDIEESNLMDAELDGVNLEKVNYERDKIEGSVKQGVEKGTKIEFFHSRIAIRDEKVECQIITGKVNDMEPYIRTLFDWASTIWNYSALNNWNTDDYSFINIKEDFFKVHILGKEEKDALFNGKYSWSPKLLHDYKDRQIQSKVITKITEDEFGKSVIEDESDDEYEIEFYNSRIVMRDENVECQIITNKVDDMESYIRALFDWATTTWDYSEVEDWNTDEYSLLGFKEEFFKIHKLEKDDKDALFLDKYEWSPEPLNDYKDSEIQAYVYIKISEEEYNKLISGEESEDEYEIEFFDSKIALRDERVECQIITDKVDDMEPYIRTLHEWVIKAWDYSTIDKWNTDEYSLIHDNKGFYKVHKLGKEDEDALFQEKYDWSPKPLDDYNDRQIQVHIYIKISEREYNRLKSEDE